MIASGIGIGRKLLCNCLSHRDKNLEKSADFLSVHPSIHSPSVHPPTHLPIYLSVHPSIHPPIRPSIHSFTPIAVSQGMHMASRR
jgi:hypothetical protein